MKSAIPRTPGSLSRRQAVVAGSRSGRRGIGALTFVAGISLAVGPTFVRADSVNPGQASGPFGEYEAGSTVRVPMVRVPGTVPGQTAPGYSFPGPKYDLWMGKYEVTNAQFAAFLNDAQLDGGATGRGSNMVFEADGRVKLPNGVTPMFEPKGAGPYSRIMYDPLASPGSRYAVEAGFENHPVTGVSWLGVVKFSNWLTLDKGLDPSQRAYTEGFSRADWHPLPISTADWMVRDLSAAERQALVDHYAGFRLPMDDLGIRWDFDSSADTPFNEWFKASAYDPAAPDVVRPLRETWFPPDHWRYGFGRETLTPADANFLQSGDPFEGLPGPDTTPVGFFNGRIYNPDGTVDEGQVFDPGDFITSPNGNLYGIYDLSGDVWEWGQDVSLAVDGRAVHGGSWVNSEGDLLSLERRGILLNELGPPLGFRVLQIPEPATLTLLALGALALTRRLRRPRRPPR